MCQAPGPTGGTPETLQNKNIGPTKKGAQENIFAYVFVVPPFSRYNKKKGGFWSSTVHSQSQCIEGLGSDPSTHLYENKSTH